MGKITAKMKSFLEQELQQALLKFDEFRLELAKTAHRSEPMEDVPNEEFLFENKIRQIKNLLYDQEIVYPVKQKEVIDLGSQVLLAHKNDREDWFILDGAGYKKGDLTIISYQSPIGQKLTGKRKGEVITHQDKEFLIRDILYPW